MLKNFNLKNKIALVTGANKGIGYSIANTFIKYGVYVIGTSTNIYGIKKINNYLGKNGVGLILDLKNKSPYIINNLIRYIIKNFKTLDILVNNAGIIYDKLVLNMKDYQWDNVLQINLTSIFRICREVIYYMIKRSFGRIINISSIVGITGNIGQANYAASKSGIIGFSKSLAKEVASKGITVNVISPGYIKTDMTSHLKKKNYDNIISQIPSKRFGYPQEIADAVIFLASDKASYITGETLNINGGLYMG
ncbi:3-oxoacyl-[acyl-carrier-protein] reductase [Enterobacteriaceae endosymbiont of Donacia marginata]|uniref:3-oxoacyl-[acyl-carrier-protein] reductase n=1 Tax=Enterobacteriaceae endosymbiont of Donacia marginata TaxID=2675779 RepID=UPI0014493DA6|nr:3-oxoacyl-[acyl-carrier-protein] reductase [Enterobacteriaceae endosymbiont of Donacia marginata]QJC38023.1 3-oxoacyl-[acyl-carrier-protein] reductase [Enterobacteriaceae endosymbiont of Donacia marginata]